MFPILLHWYRFAEVYTVLLAWIVIPLAYYAFYLFFNNHYGMFSPHEIDGKGDGAAR